MPSGRGVRPLPAPWPPPLPYHTHTWNCPRTFWKTCQSGLPTSQPPGPLETSMLGKLRKEGFEDSGVGEIWAEGPGGLRLEDKVQVMAK